MSDLVFHSALSMEEIENDFKDVDFFTGLIEGLNEAVAYKEGRASANTLVRKRSSPAVDTVTAGVSLLSRDSTPGFPSPK